MTKISSTSEWQDAVKKHIDKLTSDDERYEFAHCLIFDLALWTGYSGYEMIGLIEVVKAELLDSLIHPTECDGDCDNCDQKDKE